MRVGYHARLDASAIGFGMLAIVGLRASQSSLSGAVEELSATDGVWYTWSRVRGTSSTFKSVILSAQCSNC